MSQGACPSCGAPVTFSVGAAEILVCEFCQTMVARKGLDLESHGKIARIAETRTPFKLGLGGRFKGSPFTFVGHLQKDHGRGPWDEWYLVFDDDRTAWLSESEGAMHLMFFAGSTAVARAQLGPGARIDVKDRPFCVEEVGHANVTAAEGQFPSDLEPHAPHHYADATGKSGSFATLDFGTREEGAELFVGSRVTLDELGVARSELVARPAKVSLQQARCTQCNAPLELRAPDQTLRVGCGHCGALLDVSNGKLSFLQALRKPASAPVIELGSKGELGGVEWICIAYLQRHCTVDAVQYPWDEYLLYAPEVGFSWLMLSNGHWQHLTPLAGGEIDLRPMRAAHYQGRNYRCFQSVHAVTDTVVGEAYWEVNAGDTATATEYVAPPYSISEDATSTEVTYSHGTYLAPKVVQEAFGLREMPTPMGVAPSQPNPAKQGQGSRWRWWFTYAAALLGIFLFQSVTAARQTIVDENVGIPPGVASGSPEATRFIGPFEIGQAGNVKVEIRAQLSHNTWLGLQGDLVNEATGEVVGFYSESSYYSGRSSDGPWTEDKQRRVTWLSKVEPGSYALRLTPYFPGGTSSAPRMVQVRLVSDVPRTLWFCLAFVILSCLPLISLIRASTFETHRWSESNLS